MSAKLMTLIERKLPSHEDDKCSAFSCCLVPEKYFGFSPQYNDLRGYYLRKLLLEYQTWIYCSRMTQQQLSVHPSSLLVQEDHHDEDATSTHTFQLQCVRDSVDLRY